MSVDESIECFAFTLFRKLWIRNGLPDYAEMVPDYPIVPEWACPYDYCDTVFAFQCFSSSFFEELCKEDYNAFAHSRSDFFYYLHVSMSHFRENVTNFFFATVSLAVVAAEMGIACARRDNDIFIFTCPLAFAMVFEEAFGPHLNSVGYLAFWGEISRCGGMFSHVRGLAVVVGRSASLRRDLIYRLQLLRLELHGYCPDEFCKLLEEVIKTGAMMDNSEQPTELSSTKYKAALKFSWYLQSVHQGNFVVYLAPLYAENFIKRNDFLRKCIFQEIASLCCMTDEESKEAFFALYEESVFGERAVIPPQSEIISDSSSAQELHELHPNCIVSREIHVDGRDPDNRDAACKPEEFSGIISDSKPKDTKSRDHQGICSLDAANTEHIPEEHSGIISEGPSFNELNKLKPKDSKSRDPQDVYCLEARDIKHTVKEQSGIISADGFEDVQSNALMESPFKFEEKMKQGYGCESSRTSDIFYKLRNMTGSHVPIEASENSKLPRSFSASELKNQEVTTDTIASELKDQGISVCTLFKLKNPEISDDVNRDDPDVKIRGISISSKLNDQEGVSDTGHFGLIDQRISTDTDVSINKDKEISSYSNSFDTGNQIIFEGPGSSKFNDEMVFSPDSPISQNDARETNFEFQVLELNSPKNITSPSKVCSKSKRAVETDNLENSIFNASETRDQKIFVDESASECKDEGILSTLDDSVFHDDSGDFETLNKNSSQSTSMVIDSSDEETLFNDCQTPVFDIFSEQYLKLDKDETPFGDSSTLKLHDNEVIDENCLKPEEVLKEPVSSYFSPIIKDVYSINPHVEAFSEIESSPGDSVGTVVSVETYRLKMADRKSEKVFQSELKSPRGAADPPLELPTTKANTMHVEALEQQYESLMEKANDFCKLIDGISGIINEEEDKSDKKGSKKRKNNRLKKKNKQDTVKETEEPTVVENVPEKSEIIETNVCQLILVMGAPFEKPIKREGRFMDRITIESF